MKNKLHIQLASHYTCTGCAACASVCPTDSISMREDIEGFLMPYIDAKTCIGCHKCEKTCPILNSQPIPSNSNRKVYAAINKNEEVRMRSSSGGMFHALAKWTIEQNGVVFGAKWNEDWNVIHDYSETVEGIELFLRSKYVQSHVGDSYKKAKQFLQQGRWVLFSGTPCQIGGLKSFLDKEYETLVTVDLICHGVPSPKVWHSYLKDYLGKEKLLFVNFRDKSNGWQNKYIVTTTTTTTTRSELGSKNPYHHGFLENTYLRESCYHCHFRTRTRLADITIADFWGIDRLCPDFYDNKGTSLVITHTTKGGRVFNGLVNDNQLSVLKIDDSVDIADYNPCYIHDEIRKDNRDFFFLILRLTGSFKSAQRVVGKKLLYSRIKRKIKKIANKIKRFYDKGN